MHINSSYVYLSPVEMVTEYRPITLTGDSWRQSDEKELRRQCHDHFGRATRQYHRSIVKDAALIETDCPVFGTHLEHHDSATYITLESNVLREDKNCYVVKQDQSALTMDMKRKANKRPKPGEVGEPVLVKYKTSIPCHTHNFLVCSTSSLSSLTKKELADLIGWPTYTLDNDVELEPSCIRILFQPDARLLFKYLCTVTGDSKKLDPSPLHEPPLCKDMKTKLFAYMFSYWSTADWLWQSNTRQGALQCSLPTLKRIFEEYNVSTEEEYHFARTHHNTLKRLPQKVIDACESLLKTDIERARFFNSLAESGNKHGLGMRMTTTTDCFEYMVLHLNSRVLKGEDVDEAVELYTRVSSEWEKMQGLPPGAHILLLLSCMAFSGSRPEAGQYGNFVVRGPSGAAKTTLFGALLCAMVPGRLVTIKSCRCWVHRLHVPTT